MRLAHQMRYDVATPVQFPWFEQIKSLCCTLAWMPWCNSRRTELFLGSLSPREDGRPWIAIAVEHDDLSQWNERVIFLVDRAHPNLPLHRLDYWVLGLLQDGWNFQPVPVVCDFDSAFFRQGPQTIFCADDIQWNELLINTVHNSDQD